ncbi:Aste57867_11003 [Aphanomyces stellatus]|uniref:Aste57867_11003 protein n=1 Tax=Aphanomyces stellatus TaxID=120398 RepID=A0A485KS87_9STRA|nr:hypothetical protein As57867_010962 [Aphanomyces stellatus]VFT87871.1 Aste57867_11003 [Aphanomyces stellatus]
MNTPIPVAVPVASAPIPPASFDQVSKAESPPTLLAFQAEQLDTPSLSTFDVDFYVRTHALLGSDNWLPRQFVIHGQTLHVRHKTDSATTIVTYDTTRCAIEHLSETMLQLVQPETSTTVFFCPSVTIRDRFLHVLAAAATTPHWVKPASTVLDDTIAVAQAILETNVNMKASPLKPIEVVPSGITVAHVQSYLGQLKVIYDAMPVAQSEEDLYEYVLGLEAAFLDNATTSTTPSSTTLIQHVLRLYPDEAANNFAKLTLQLDCRQCPHCAKPFNRTIQKNIHVGGRVLVCNGCRNRVHYETLKLGQLRREMPSFEYKVGLVGFRKTAKLPLPKIPQDGMAASFMKRMWHELYNIECETSHRMCRDDKHELEERIMPVMNRLDLVQLAYRQLLFISQIVPHWTYWTHSTVLEAAILRHDRFRHLSFSSDNSPPLVATLDILLVTQVHQMMTNQVVYPASNGSANIAAHLGDTSLLWHKSFYEPYSSCKLDLNAWLETKPGTDSIQQAPNRKRWATHCQLPSSNCRYVGVDELFSTDSVRHVPFLTGDAVGISVIGALESDLHIFRGKLRHVLPDKAHTVYTYKYERAKVHKLQKLFLGYY